MNPFGRSILVLQVRHRIGLITQASRLLLAAGASTRVLALGALVGLVYVVVTRRWRLGLASGAAFLAASVATGLLKDLIGRARPPAQWAVVHLSGASMPSRHAARTAAVALVAWLCLDWVSPQVRRTAGVPLVAAVVGIGVVMIYLGVRWTTDVLAGWTLGALVAWCTHLAAPSPLPEVRPAPESLPAVGHPETQRSSTGPARGRAAGRPGVVPGIQACQAHLDSRGPARAPRNAALSAVFRAGPARSGPSPRATPR